MPPSGYQVTKAGSATSVAPDVSWRRLLPSTATTNSCVGSWGPDRWVNARRRPSGDTAMSVARTPRPSRACSRRVADPSDSVARTWPTKDDVEPTPCVMRLTTMTPGGGAGASVGCGVMPGATVWPLRGASTATSVVTIRSTATATPATRQVTTTAANASAAVDLPALARGTARIYGSSDRAATRRAWRCPRCRRGRSGPPPGARRRRPCG